MTAFNVAMLITADPAQARRGLKEAEAEVQKFGAAARQAGNTAAAGFDKAEAEILQFRRASTGATSNLVAQFNDVGQMLAAGQSPLLLAAQQGTQISQVLGPLGAAGAVRALGDAFLGMLSPVNLAVFAAVAALGILGNSLRGTLGETQTVEDKIAEVVSLTDDLEASAKAYREGAAASRTSVAELAVTYGDLADEIARARDQQERMTLAQAAATQNRTVDDLAGRAGGSALSLIGPADIAVLDEFIEKGEIARAKLAELNAFDTDDRLVVEQLASLQQLADQYGITAEAALQIVQASAVLENTSGIGAQAEAAEALAAQLEASFGSTEAVNAALPGVLAGLQAIVKEAGGMASEISASADEAARLAGNLAAAQQRLAAQGKVYSGRGGDPRTSNNQGVGGFVYTGPRLDENNNPVVQGRSAGARGASRQADAGQRLLTQLEREHAILLVTDPVQKEIIRNREALAQLMGEERVRAEQLILTNARLREQQQLEKQGWEDIKQAGFDALDGLILKGETLADVMANVANWIAEALLQSALLGTGPLAGIWGGQGTGLFDIVGKGLGIPGAATGGMITGPGGPRDDSILARLSNGEFVVNAAATARHRPLLEAINAAPRFATGGMVGGGANSPFGPGAEAPAAVVESRLTDDLDARVAETSQAVSVRVTRAGIEEYDRKVMPKKMRAVQADPRRVG